MGLLLSGNVYGETHKNENVEEIVSLSNSVWEVTISDALYEFFSDGSCQHTQWDWWTRTFTACTWSHDGKNFEWILDKGNFVYVDISNLPPRFQNQLKNPLNLNQVLMTTK